MLDQFTLLTTQPAVPSGGFWSLSTLVGVLLALATALLIWVVLTLRIMRRRHRAAPRRPGSPTPDPWLESGRRLKEEEPNG
jgi:hypothetical protein